MTNKQRDVIRAGSEAGSSESRDLEERERRDEETRRVGRDMRHGYEACERAHARDSTRRGTLHGEDVTRNGADKAKRGHDIDDKGRDEGSDKQSGDVTRSRKRGDARSDFCAYKARLWT